MNYYYHEKEAHYHKKGFALVSYQDLTLFYTPCSWEIWVPRKRPCAVPVDAWQPNDSSTRSARLNIALCEVSSCIKIIIIVIIIIKRTLI